MSLVLTHDYIYLLACVGKNNWGTVRKAVYFSLCLPFSPFSALQARRERVEMALKARSHEILMGEMTVLVRGYRHERGRLCETNRRLVQRLAEIEAQV